MATQLQNGNVEYSSELIKIIGLNRDLWTILLRNIALPTMVDNNLICYQNNILIQNDVNGELWFCSKINIVYA